MKKYFSGKNVIRQMIYLKQNFIQTEGNVFGKVLNCEDMMDGLTQIGKKYRDRIFTPIVTLRCFLMQILSADHSCREAVSQIVAELSKEGKDCSSNTASYCAARKKISLEWIKGLMMSSAQRLHEESLNVWGGRSIKLVDGTTVSMPDTPANQKKYPQVKGQKKGVGFPIARMVAIISLNCGVVLDFAIGACKGKSTGEHGLFRTIMSSLKKRYFVRRSILSVVLGNVRVNSKRCGWCF